MFLNQSALVVLLRESGTDDDEALAAFFFCQHIDGLCAELGGDAENGALHLWKVIDLGVAFHALHLSLFRVHCVNRTSKRTLKKVFQSFSTWFVNVTRCTAHYDAFRI